MFYDGELNKGHIVNSQQTGQKKYNDINDIIKSWINGDFIKPSTFADREL